MRSTISQPVASAATAIMIAGMCAAVLLTNGRAVASEEAVLASIDDAGTRTIVVRADPDSGVTPDIVQHLASVEGVSWIGAFGPAADVSNLAFPGGTRVPVRDLWSADFRPLGVVPKTGTDPTVWLSRPSLNALGMTTAAGAVQTLDGRVYGVAGGLHRPDYLSFLDPLAVVRRDIGESGQVAVVVVLAARPTLVAPLTAVVRSALSDVDPATVKIETSRELAELRALVGGQLGDSGRSLVLLVFCVTAILVGAMQFGLVMFRRKDFGRRRALGASQRLIVALLLLQTATVAACGSILGSLVALVTLSVIGDPLPTMVYVLALSILAVFIGALAGLLPAVVAAWRDPIRELRVP